MINFKHPVVIAVEIAIASLAALVVYKKYFSENKTSKGKGKKPIKDNVKSTDTTKKWKSLMENGTLKFKKEEYAEALDFFTKAIEAFEIDNINKDSLAVIYYNRSSTYLKLDKQLEAKEDLTQAIELKEDYAKVYLKRAIINEKLNLTEDCLKDLVSLCILEDHSVIENNKFRDRILRKKAKNIFQDQKREFIAYAMPYTIRTFLDSYDGVTIVHEFCCQLTKIFNNSSIESIIEHTFESTESCIMIKLLSTIINWKSYRFHEALEDLDFIFRNIHVLDDSELNTTIIKFLCFLYKARVYTCLNQYDKSDENFEYAIQMISDIESSNKQQLESICFFEQARDKFSRLDDLDGVSGLLGNNKSAIILNEILVLLDKTIENNTNFPYCYLEKAKVFSRKIIYCEQLMNNEQQIKQEDYSLLFQDVIELLTNNLSKSACCLFLSQIMTQIGNVEESKKLVAQAESIDPEDLDIKIQSLFINSSETNFNDLIKQIELIIEQNPLSYVAYEMLHILLSGQLHQSFDLNIAEKLVEKLTKMANISNTEVQREVIIAQKVGLQLSLDVFNTIKRSSPKYVPIPIF